MFDHWFRSEKKLAKKYRKYFSDTQHQLSNNVVMSNIVTLSIILQLDCISDK